MMMPCAAYRTGSERRPMPTSNGPDAAGVSWQEPPVDLEAVYYKYHRQVYRWCLRVVRNPEDAEDAAQDAFVHLVRKIHTFRGEADFSTWLYRVVMNTVFMRLRRKRLALLSLDEVMAFGESSASPRDFLPVTDMTMRGAAARIDLERAIDQLPEGFRESVLLHDFEEYTHEEIAGLRSWTAGTSKSQLHKARLRLRKLLHHDREKTKEAPVQPTFRGGAISRRHVNPAQLASVDVGNRLPA